MLKRFRLFLLLAALAVLGCGGSDNSTILPTPAGNAVPTLTSISQTTTLAGSTSFPLDLNGTGFISGSSVTFGTTALATTFVSSTQLQVTVPDSLVANAAIIPVSVSNPTPGGGTSNTLDFTVANPIPTLDQVSVVDVLAGSSSVTLEITGTNFNSSTQVNLGTATLTPSAFTKTTLSVAVPDALLANAGIFGLSVFNRGPGGGSSTPREFTVSNPLPSLDSISAPSVLVGSNGFTLDITGNNFVSGTLVEIGGSTFTPLSITKTHLSVAIPASFLTTAAIHNVDIFNPGPGGGKSGNKEFMVANPSPTLKFLSYSLASVVAGKSDFTLGISGKDFMPGATVDVGNSTGLTAASITSTKITVVVPAAEIANAGRLSVTVHNPPPGGGTSEFLTFMVSSEPVDGIWAQAPWQTVVNAGTLMPNSARKFNSYTQPAVNTHGLVAFRAHSKGTDSSGGSGEGEGETAVAAAAPIEQGEPVKGIYKVDMTKGMSKTVEEIATGNTEVPWPNNTAYQDGLASFNEFPSVARIAMDVDAIAFRGQSQPVWTYTDPVSGTESRAGSGGIYVSLQPNGDPQHDKLRTGIGLLGAVPPSETDDFSYMQVPGAAITPTKFDQFPGSPAVADQFTIAFKGNYTEGDTGRTGVFYRDVFAQDGRAPVQLVANSTMIMPNQPEGGIVPFGSTAPPSTGDGYMVFSGFDNEDAPTLGGIYRAPLTPSPLVGTNPLIETLVAIGDPVPGESATFNRLGEGVSFDGRYVGFWGAWGSETKSLLLICATDGNKDMLASCNEMYPNGFETTVPLHQGIFVYDLETKLITPIAKTGDNFDDFVYWGFSGRPPGAHGGAGEDLVPEPPRWRSSSFVAVSGKNQPHLRVAFKGKIGSVDGVYLRQEGDPAETQVLLDTTVPAQNVDPLAPAGASITSLGIERDGFRGDWLVLTTGMLDPVTSESWSGIYVTHIPQP